MNADGITRPALRLQSPSRRVETCAEHGQYDAYRVGDQGWARCAKCVLVDEVAADRLQNSGLRGRFVNATFDGFEVPVPEQKQVLAECRRYVAELQRDAWTPLLLIGPPGAGKSHLGAAIVRATILERRMRGVMLTVREVIRDLRDTWRKGSEQSEEQRIDFYGCAPLLVLDELGVGFGSDSELVQLFDVIDRRYQMAAPTVFISNLSVPMLRQSVGDRLFDRINEASRVLVCNWASHRMPGAAQ